MQLTAKGTVLWAGAVVLSGAALPQPCAGSRAAVNTLPYSSGAAIDFPQNGARPGLDSLYHEIRPAMGTAFEVYLYAADPMRAAELFEVVFEEIERVEASLSNYRPTSELSRLNTQATRGPVTTDPETFALIERSVALSRRTGGAFDITVGPLMKAWGFFRGEGRYPSENDLVRARAQTGWEAVELDEEARTVRLLAPEAQLDLGAVGKGHALDRVASVLRTSGVHAALIGAGQSSYYAIGSPSGEEGWPVHVPDPVERERTLSTVLLRDQALSTSGNYEKFFELDGRVYCHIFDPRTGHPVEGTLQVTVLAASAFDSDALSTSLFVLGPREGARLLDEHEGAAALLVSGTAERLDVVPLSWVAEIRR